MKHEFAQYLQLRIDRKDGKSSIDESQQLYDITHSISLSEDDIQDPFSLNHSLNHPQSRDYREALLRVLDDLTLKGYGIVSWYYGGVDQITFTMRRTVKVDEEK